MSDWFSTLAAGSKFPMDATSELQERGFAVIPGPTRPELLAKAYAAAVASATSDDIRIGSTSTKVNDFVNRGAEFDNLYVFPPLLEACCRVIGRTVQAQFAAGADAATRLALPRVAR
jgi:hypothetical protein